MQNRVVLIVLLALLSVMSAAQQKSDRLKPQWLKSLPERSNQTFDYYVVESADAYTLAEARQNCFSELMAEAGLEKGVTTVTDYKSSESEFIVWDNDSKSESVESSFFMNSNVKGKEVDIYGHKVDEYWERTKDGKIHLWTLYARSEIDVKPNFDPVKRTNMYGANGLWRSAILPGWGQFYKGDKLKGSLMLGGTAVLGVGIVLMENQRAEYMRLISKTHNAETKQVYASRATNWSIGRNVCIGAVSALYVYNLIDVLVAPGARRIVRLNDGKRNYAIAPTVMPDGSAGLYATLTF